MNPFWVLCWKKPIMLEETMFTIPTCDSLFPFMYTFNYKSNLVIDAVGQTKFR